MSPKEKQKPIKKISEINKTIEDVAEKINKELFNGEIAPYVLTIQTQGRKKGTMGWAYTGNNWSAKKGSGYQELNICAEYLMDAFQVYDILVHELVHIWNSQNDIKDCSGNQYHNLKFKSKAEEVGLIVEKGRRGWAYTKVKEGGVADKLYKKLKLKADTFSIARDATSAKRKAPTKMKKWTCGCTNVRCAVDLIAVCQNCFNEFENVA